LKTTLCPFDGDDIDLFELYAERWSIRGADQYSAEWIKNPRGYRPLNGSDAEKLAKINAVRSWLSETLRELDCKLRTAFAGKDVKGVASALYGLLTGLNVRDKLNARSKECADAGRKSEAAELASAFRGTVTALEQLCDAYGDARCPADLKELYTALSALFDSLMLGSIPDSSDSAVFGSANMLRVESARFVLLLGVNCGEFPASTVTEGLFSDDERDAFIKAGIRLMRDRESAASDELYFFRRAVASASEGVFIFSRNPGASIPVIRLKNIAQFGTVPSEALLKERITSPRLAAEYEHALSGTSLGEALARLVAECRADGRLPRMPAAPEPVSAGTYSLSETAARLCYPAHMSLSQSAFESFANCPMKYVLGNKIGLSESGKSVFSQNDAGIFVHYELEHLLKLIFDGKPALISDYSERKKETDRLARDYIRNNIPDISLLNRHALERLCFLACSIAASVAEELSGSGFRPAAYELPIGGGGFPPLVLSLSDGGSVSFSGKIDRVDVFRDGDVAWIRTVDYNTGNISFSIGPGGEVKGGSQLLFYLFNLTRQNNPEFARRFFGGEPKEASVCYVSSAQAEASSNQLDEEAVSAEIAGAITRLGCMIDNESVVSAADPGKAYGENLATVSQQDFDRMFEAVKEDITQAVETMQSGEASGIGLDDGCDTCPYSFVCRSNIKKT
ncbi:MAG: PD-(D/E)XK nuclease family protein, partial [Clostridia bacterium]|nr:PD-(D/E)XK nuclease family protein [Clostridia bacterium]